MPRAGVDAKGLDVSNEATAATAFPRPRDDGDRNATAADFVRHFGHWRDTTREGPVFVTHHGRSTHVLMDVAAYHQMERHAALAAQAARAPAEAPALPEGDPLAVAVDAFIEWLDHAALICDADMRIRAINRTACSMIGKPAAMLVGQVLWDAVPQLAGSLSQGYALRALRSGEPTSADLPSPLRPDTWVRLEVFPLGTGIGIIGRDITEDVTRNRLANVKETILRAMSVHGGIGYMRLSTIGTIERVDDPLCAMIGLPEDRLIGVAGLDIVVRRERVAVRDELARVMSAGGEACFETALLSNEGREVPVRVALVALRGAYGIEGSVAVFTRAAAPASVAAG